LRRQSSRRKLAAQEFTKDVSRVSCDPEEPSLGLQDSCKWPVAEHVLAGLEELAREDPDLQAVVEAAYLHAASSARRQ
jgi:hypothetical protein